MGKRRKKIKLKKGAKILLVVILVIAVSLHFGLKRYKEYLYQQTYEYKLLQKEYPMEDVKVILEKLDNDYINTLLEEDSEYDKNIALLLNQKYFIRKNLDRYLAYIKKNKKEEINNVVSIVNTNRDGDFYDKISKTDISKDTLMLVNKYYYLEEDYVPDIVKVGSSYAYQGNKIRQDVLDAFINMQSAAKDEDIVLIINSSYRSYADQQNVWTARKNINGIAKADQYAARAGFSEHQSGLAIDIAQFNSSEDDFENTPGFTWLTNHAHEYGFILRYPKDKENLTGYNYESWHYRYVGVEVATKVKEENITYDEYYAYYLDN